MIENGTDAVATSLQLSAVPVEPSSMRVDRSPGRMVRSALALLFASTAAWSAVVAAPAARATTASQLSGAQQKLHAVLADIKKATAERAALRARLSVLLAQVD